MNQQPEAPPPLAVRTVGIAKEFGIWLHEKTNGLIMPAENSRQRISQSLYHLSLEHYDAIVILMERRVIGSAFALGRSLLETCVRGKWISGPAQDAEVERFLTKGKLKHFSELLDDIGSAPETGGRLLNNIRGQNWNFLCGFTHGGMEQVRRRVTESTVESLYPIEEQANLLQLAVEVAILVAAEVFALAGSEERLIDLHEKAACVRCLIKESQSAQSSPS